MNPDQQVENHDPIAALTNRLVDELKAKSAISTPHVETAFRAVPRHLFVPEVALEEAYRDRPIVTKQHEGMFLSSSSQPTIMAVMLEQLDLQPGHKVLEIGAGTGYNAALMAQIVGEQGEVTTVDIDQDIVEGAKTHLSAADFERVRVICADGGYGYSESAPYDRIILTVGAADIPPAWWQQLKPDGRLVMPFVIQDVHQVVAFERTNGHLVSVSVKRGAFMMLRGHFAGSPPNFVPLTSSAAQANLLVQAIKDQPVDGEKVYTWLTGISRDWDTGVMITPNDFAYFGNFGLWMSVHLPAMFALVAQGEMIEQGIVPTLGANGGEKRAVYAAILLGDEGIAALMRPPGQPIPWHEDKDPFAPDEPFSLYVRQFGADESVAQRFIGVIKSWQEAGRPSTEQLRLRVYPKAVGYTPLEGELVVDTQWNRLIVGW